MSSNHAISVKCRVWIFAYFINLDMACLVYMSGVDIVRPNLNWRDNFASWNNVRENSVYSKYFSIVCSVYNWKHVLHLANCKQTKSSSSAPFSIQLLKQEAKKDRAHRKHKGKANKSIFLADEFLLEIENALRFRTFFFLFVLVPFAVRVMQIKYWRSDDWTWRANQKKNIFFVSRELNRMKVYIVQWMWFTLPLEQM